MSHRDYLTASFAGAKLNLRVQFEGSAAPERLRYVEANAKGENI